MGWSGKKITLQVMSQQIETGARGRRGSGPQAGLQGEAVIPKPRDGKNQWAELKALKE